MLKEERHLRNFLSGGYCPQSIPEEKKVLSRLIASLVRAVREDCAKVAEMHECHQDEDWQGEIAQAIRSKK